MSSLTKSIDDIYNSNKKQLIENCKSHGLPTEGFNRELRSRLVTKLTTQDVNATMKKRIEDLADENATLKRALRENTGICSNIMRVLCSKTIGTGFRDDASNEEDEDSSDDFGYDDVEIEEESFVTEAKEKAPESMLEPVVPDSHKDADNNILPQRELEASINKENEAPSVEEFTESQQMGTGQESQESGPPPSIPLESDAEGKDSKKHEEAVNSQEADQEQQHIKCEKKQDDLGHNRKRADNYAKPPKKKRKISNDMFDTDLNSDVGDLKTVLVPDTLVSLAPATYCTDDSDSGKMQRSDAEIDEDLHLEDSNSNEVKDIVEIHCDKQSEESDIENSNCINVHEADASVYKTEQLGKEAEISSEFTIGQHVQCKDEHKEWCQWYRGIITSLHPLKVKPDGWGTDFEWDQIRKITYTNKIDLPSLDTKVGESDLFDLPTEQQNHIELENQKSKDEMELETMTWEEMEEWMSDFNKRFKLQCSKLQNM